MIRTAKRSWPELISHVVWLVFLALIVWASFIQSWFPSSDWWAWLSVLFLSLGLLAIAACGGARLNLKVLRIAPWFFALLVLHLLWLAFPLILPLGNPAYDWILAGNASGVGAPQWFTPKRVLSFTPEKTWLLFISEVAMATFLLLAVLLISTRARAQQLLLVILILTLLHASIGLVLKFAGLNIVDVNQLDGNYGAARGLFVNRNHFAAFLSLGCVAGLSILLKPVFSNHQPAFSKILLSQMLEFKKLLATLAMAVVLVAMALSQSRAGFFGLFVSAISILMLLQLHVQIVQHNLKMLFALFVVIASGVLFFEQGLLQRLFQGDALLGERLIQWQVTWQIIKEQWLVGYGGNSYADVFQFFRGDVPLRELIYNQAHNDYLHIWLESGLIGLLLWLGMLLLLVRYAFHHFKRSKSSLVLAGVCSSMIVIFAALLQSLVDFNLHILSVRLYFFLSIALLLSLPHVEHKKRRRA